MFPPSSTRRPVKNTTRSAICVAISIGCALAGAGIKYHMTEENRHRAPYWYSSDDPCDYRIGDQYGRFTVCDGPGSAGGSPVQGPASVPGSDTTTP